MKNTDKNSPSNNGGRKSRGKANKRAEDIPVGDKYQNSNIHYGPGQLAETLRMGNQQPSEYYDVNGIRYIRQDLVPDKMDKIMDRIATAQEVQANFYKKYDGMIAPLMEMAEKAIKEQIAKMKSKSRSPLKPFNHL